MQPAYRSVGQNNPVFSFVIGAHWQGLCRDRSDCFAILRMDSTAESLRIRFILRGEAEKRSAFLIHPDLIVRHVPPPHTQAASLRRQIQAPLLLAQFARQLSRA